MRICHGGVQFRKRKSENVREKDQLHPAKVQPTERLVRYEVRMKAKTDEERTNAIQCENGNMAGQFRMDKVSVVVSVSRWKIILWDA